MTKTNKQLLFEYSSLLNKIFSARTFIMWQTYNKIKRNPKLIIKASNIFLKEGFHGIRKWLNFDIDKYLQLSNVHQQYQVWYTQNYPSVSVLNDQIRKSQKFKYQPKISIIIPVYNPNPKLLEETIISVINQTYPNWQLCLADDYSADPEIRSLIKNYSQNNPKIKYIFRKHNGNISQASNSALKLATGQFIGFLDHDDYLWPNALFEVVKVLNKDKNVNLIYTDEDKIDEKGQEHSDPYFKPDWSPDLLRSFNYFCHFTLIRKSIVDKIGGFRVGYEGSQDYDLFLRAVDQIKPETIYHLPTILYSWRKTQNSTALSYDNKGYADQASIKALNDHLARNNIKGKAQQGLVGGTFRTSYKIIGNPLISIIIPTKNNLKYFQPAIESILKKTNYSNYEIIIVDTGVINKKIKTYFQQLQKLSNIKILIWDKQFNYSQVNNFAVQKTKGDYILFLNDDTKVINTKWLSAMLEHAQRKEVGAVGAKLLYPDDTIQHAGVILGIKGGNIEHGIAGHAQKCMPDKPLGSAMLNSKDVIRNYSAVTAACLMIAKNKFLEVGGFEEKLRIAFNDVDLNLKLLKKAYINVYTPFAKLYHYESVSIQKPGSKNRSIQEFQQEINFMLKKWGNVLEEDKYYNPNLSLKNEFYEIEIK